VGATYASYADGLTEVSSAPRATPIADRGRQCVRTELHFHLLPGVDDGPRNAAEAIALASLAVADGTGRIVVTPHVRSVVVGELADRAERLRSLLREAGIELDLRAGGELSPDDVQSLGDAQLEALAQGPPGRRWLLVEAPLQPTRPDLATAAGELRARGFEVLIAHPERSRSTPLAQLRAQVALGACLQLNASSLLGAHGREAERVSLTLADSGMPFVLASDAHSASRPPLLTEGAARLAAAGVDPAVIAFAAETGPERLLSDGLPVACGQQPRHGLRALDGPTDRV
jgi:protein-tyrosine phosphatase